MIDDLVKRLLDWSEYDEGKINDAREEAAYRIEKLEAALREAVEDIEFWGAYASEYFQDKHDLKSSIQNARKALEGKDD